MATEKWQKVKEVFDAALRQEPEARQNYINEACGDDKDLLTEVESLVSSFDKVDDFLEEPAVAQLADLIESGTKTLEAGTGFGHYEVIRQIGSGGMGEVYLAKDKKLDRKVAVKILNYNFSQHESNLQRFIREAKSASALNHPNILVIHEIGEAGEAHYIVSEFIEGKTLREIFKEKTLKLSEILDISIQIANALCTAHEAHLVHRDIKPENIMIRPDGFVKVLDFGLAKLVEQKNKSILGLEESTGRQNQTAKGVILGTVNYMSAEQAKGERVDERTDIFSLGVVIYEMVAGRTPFAGDTISETFANLINAEPKPVSRFSSNVPDELQRIVSKMLRKDREERYQTMKDVLTDLRDVRENLKLDQKGEKAHSPESENAILQATTGDANQRTAETQKTFSPTIKLHKALAGFALVLLLIVAMGFGYYFFYAGKSALGGGDKKSIAVLPLKPINTANRDQIYELGIADSVILKISSSRNLIVRQLHAVRNYVELDRDLIEIGKEQNVDFVLASNYQIANGKIKVTSQLLDVATGKVEDAFTVEKDSTDLFSAQDAIAGAIGSKLIARFGGATNGYEAKRGTTSEEAYRLYLQGMYLVEKGDKAGTIRSIELFDQAINLDPNYAAAWAGKGHAHCAYSHMGDNPPAVEYEIARPALERALELDGNLSEAYAVLGIFNTDFRWDFAEGEKHFLRAIELNPSSDFTYRWYGNRLVNYGRTDEAVAAMKTAIDNNPTNIFHHRIYGWVLYIARRHDESIEELKRVVEMDPGFVSAYDNLWLAYHAKGDHARAFEWFMKYHERAQTSSEMITQLNAAHQNSGWQGVLQRQRAVTLAKVKKGEFSPRYYRIAVLSALVGDKDQALESLNEAFKYRSANITFLKTDPALDSLRGDPRFQELVQRAGI
jgi:serine/threonine protein kinase/Tfp pilus assembly protein PilF